MAERGLASPERVLLRQAGPVDEARSYDESIWDIQRHHATFFCDPPAGHPLYLNEQAPANYLDLTRYTTPSG
jgi:hypothetical protein